MTPRPIPPPADSVLAILAAWALVVATGVVLGAGGASLALRRWGR